MREFAIEFYTRMHKSGIALIPDYEGGSAIMQAADVLATELAVNIFAFLNWREILIARGVCKHWVKVATLTPVPPSNKERNIRGHNWKDPEPQVGESYRGRLPYAAVVSLTKTLPCLQQLSLHGVLWQDGRSALPSSEHWWSRESIWYSGTPPMHDISIISQFKDLRNLYIPGGDFQDGSGGVFMSGIYPCLFNFPKLRVLNIGYASDLIWDLEMLSGLPVLEELLIWDNPRLTGDVKNLEIVKDTIRKIKLAGCEKVVGNLLYLSSFPQLEELHLWGTSVTGDLRQMPSNGFQKLQKMQLNTVTIDHIDDATDFTNAICPHVKRAPGLFKFGAPNYGHQSFELSPNSNDFYPSPSVPAPFLLEIVKAGCRFGWRWTNTTSCSSKHDCEINWFDPEPSEDTDGNEDYQTELQALQKFVILYKGFHKPPTEDEYERICSGHWSPDFP